MLFYNVNIFWKCHNGPIFKVSLLELNIFIFHFPFLNFKCEVKSILKEIWSKSVEKIVIELCRVNTITCNFLAHFIFFFSSVWKYFECGRLPIAQKTFGKLS